MRASSHRASTLNCSPSAWRLPDSRLGYTNVPAVAEPGIPDALEREPGVVMISALGFTADHFAAARRTSGERAWWALYMGQPSSPEGGLIKRDWLDTWRLPAAPQRPVYTVVGVDPSYSGSGDSCGIVAASLTGDGTVAVIADASAPMTSDQWARAAVELVVDVGALEVAVEAFAARETYLRVVILERVCGPLADFLTGGSGAERMLQGLEDANAFVTSLDARRFWFRYHRLFADLLQLELRRASPALVGSLHRAAAEWHEQQGFIVEAIGHAQVARDWSPASRLLADHHIDLAFDGGWGTVCQLLSAFPADVAAADPELALVSATARLLDGALDKSRAYVDLAGRMAYAVPADRRPGFDVLLAALRLALARWHGDLETVLEMRPLLEAALAAQPPGDSALGDEIRCVAFQNLGVAELWSSRLDGARRDLEQGLALARRAGRPWLEIPCLAHLGIAGPLTGLSLSAGLALSHEAVRIVDAHGWGDDPVVVTALATGAMALLWLGRLDEAEQWLERAGRAVRPGGEPGTELIVDYARALLRLARGSLAEALAALHSATQMEGLLAGEHAFAPVVRARLVQTEARLGELPAARAALDDASDEERNGGDMRAAAAVVHLSQGELEHAIEVLAPVLDGSAPVLHRPSMLTEAQLLDAVAREQLGDQRAAEASLERALDLAEPEGVLLPFILVPVQPLLDLPAGRRTAHPALRRAVLDVLAGAVPHAGAPAANADELSEAELRVVRYLPTNLRTPEIASELFVSTNTVRTHLRHIYAKLGAHGRAEAVDRARELGLLAPSHRRR